LSSKDLKILMLVAKPTFDQNSNFSGYRGIIKDITQQHQLSERVVYQASYDQLTGLINRQTFNEKLKAYLSNKQNNQAPRFLCILDLDRFKLVNDSAGHLVGDAMLCEVATLIKQSITNKDLLARLGGDEFALLVNDSTLEQAQLTCEKIISTIRSYKFIWNERIFDSGISIGMVPITYGLNATELLSKADLACYKAKELGRGRVYITDHGNNSLYNEALQIGYIANISQAITNNQFFLVKQQIAPLSSSISEQAHYEILIRFKALD
ncbi:diguanylate cyclase, partial [Pseudoalteromonas sp. Z1A6]